MLQAEKSALIFGATGQDGAYLAKFLLKKGYTVHGVKRRTSLINTDRVDDIYQDLHMDNVRFKLYYGDLTDSCSVISIIQRTKPDEIYNLGAQSHVKVSFYNPEYTANVDALGTLRILEAIHLLGMSDKVRFYQASSSEMYGKVQEIPQRETTPFYPRSPYAAAKVFAYWITVNYREAYNMYAVNGILFNHESPRRGETFVTRKITQGLARIIAGKQEYVFLGNLDAKRDWGYAKDYVEVMWRMLQEDVPRDYVIGMGETHSVREFVELAARHIGVEIAWRGDKEQEEGYDVKTGKVYIKIDPAYYRPTEVDFLLSDPAFAYEQLKYKPKCSFEKLVAKMMRADIRAEGAAPFLQLPQI
ncbi:MAG: GDP-mannose 4,6-dehydratase [Chlamydiae bacterium RIFCSPHIGHO2_12_FULL_49_11]|nr:MAG: GDP-mannose 4,6-dehydratase [Chlamydiae bacterium RIFCSPHIGHO2_12_FULL_49_11]